MSNTKTTVKQEKEAVRLKERALEPKEKFCNILKKKVVVLVEYSDYKSCRWKGAEGEIYCENIIPCYQNEVKCRYSGISPLYPNPFDEEEINMIDEYSFGKMVVNGKVYTNDLIVFPHKIKSDWWRKEGHSLSLEDISEILEDPPEFLIIGTGASSCMEVPEKVQGELKTKGIKLIIEPTNTAYKTFNEKVRVGKTVGAFHLTC